MYGTGSGACTAIVAVCGSCNLVPNAEKGPLVSPVGSVQRQETSTWSGSWRSSSLTETV